MSASDMAQDLLETRPHRSRSLTRISGIAAGLLAMLATIDAFAGDDPAGSTWQDLARSTHSCRMLERCGGSIPECVETLASRLLRVPAGTAIAKMSDYCRTHMAETLPKCTDESGTPEVPAMPPISVVCPSMQGAGGSPPPVPLHGPFAIYYRREWRSVLSGVVDWIAHRDSEKLVLLPEIRIPDPQRGARMPELREPATGESDTLSDPDRPAGPGGIAANPSLGDAVANAAPPKAATSAVIAAGISAPAIGRGEAAAGPSAKFHVAVPGDIRVSPDAVTLADASSEAPLPSMIAVWAEEQTHDVRDVLVLHASLRNLNQPIDGKAKIRLIRSGLPDQLIELRVRATDPPWMLYVLPVAYLLAISCYDTVLLSSKRRRIANAASNIITTAEGIAVPGTAAEVAALVAEADDVALSLENFDNDEAGTRAVAMEALLASLRSAERAASVEAWQKALQKERSTAQLDARKRQNEKTILENAIREFTDEVRRSETSGDPGVAAALVKTTERFQSILELMQHDSVDPKTLWRSLVRALPSGLRSFLGPIVDHATGPVDPPHSLLAKAESRRIEMENTLRTLEERMAELESLDKELASGKLESDPVGLQSRMAAALGAGDVTVISVPEVSLVEQLETSRKSVENSVRLGWMERALSASVSLVATCAAIASSPVDVGYTAAFMIAITAREGIRGGMESIFGAVRAGLAKV